MKYLRALLTVLIVAVLLYFFLQNVNFKEVVSIIKGINPLYPVVFFLGLYLQYYIRAYRWGIILGTHKKNISFWNLYHYTLIGFFISTLIPGRVGEPARGILLAADENINKSYGLASVVIERLIDILMIVLFFIVSLFFLDPLKFPLLQTIKGPAFIALPFILFIFLLFYLINLEKAFAYFEQFTRFCGKLIPSRFREKVISFIIDFVKGLRIKLTSGDFVKLIISSVFVWLIQIPFYWFLLKGFSFGQEVSFFATMPYFSIIVLSAAVPTPGMAGSFDAASRLTLEQLYQAPSAQATAYTLLAHFLIIAVMIIPGLVSVWAKGVNLKTIRSIKETKEEDKKKEE